MAHEYPKDFILYDVSHEEVYLTGDWCDWKPNAIKMTKIPNLYFIATVLLPYNTKVAYKYIVNGTWMTNPEEQSETDAAGNTNNVFTTPSEAESTAHVASSGAHQSSGLTAPLTGASSTSTSAPAATSSSSPKGAAEEIQEAKTTGVPVGAAVAGSGIAAAAAGTAVAAGLGKSETEGVTGVEKVAPNVTQATSTSSASGLGSEKDLAKPDLGTSSTSSSTKAPLPASTADAPVAPGSATGEVEHKGLFSVIGGLAAGAAAAAAKAAYDLEHKIEERFNESNTISSASSNVVGSEGARSATQSPAAVSTSGEKMITTAHAGALGTGASSPLSGRTSAAESHKENPASALDPIATNAGVSKITKEFAAVDFDHTKQEVVHAVERLGEVIAGGLSGIGAAHEGREIPAISDFWAKKGSTSATSAFGKSLHDNEPTSNNSTSTTTGQNGVTPLGGLASFSSPAAAWPANNGVPSAGATSATSATKEGNTAAQAKDGSSASAHTLPPVTGGPALYPAGNSAPAAIKIDTPKTSTSQVQSESAKAGAHAPALDSTAMHPVTGSSATSTGNNGAATGATAAAVTSAGTSTTAPAATTAAPAAASTTIGTSEHHHDHPDKKQPSIIDDLKKGIKGDHNSVTHAPVATAGTGMLGPGAVAEHESHGLINNNKKDASTLGLASGTTTASSTGPPTTPKKTAAVGNTSSAATPATPKTDAYNTAPSTPSGTPADGKRKSSIFRKIKSALSPSK